MTCRFTVANLTFSVENSGNGQDRFELPKRLFAYADSSSESSAEVECNIAWERCSRFAPMDSGSCIYNVFPFRRIYFDGVSNLFTIDYFKLGRLLSRGIVSKNWKEITLLEKNSILTKPFSLGQSLVFGALTAHDALVFHASGIDCGGNGILFTAPSGTGKSTQARLWEKHQGALIFNHDRVAVTCSGGEAMGHGLPWGGGDDITLNHHVPLRGIIVLKQARENRIEQLSPSQAMPYLISYSYHPRWDSESMDRVCTVLERMISRVPVFRLACRPDSAAVDLVRSALSLPGA